VPGIGAAAASAPVVLALVRESVEAAGTGALSFRLPLRAKSAMAEILVSDHCERRPPLLIGGRLRFGRAERRGAEILRVAARILRNQACFSL
jgi:hypothetical protein